MVGWAYFLDGLVHSIYVSHVTKIQHEESGASPRFVFLEIFCCDEFAK